MGAGVGGRRLQLSLWDDTMPSVPGQRLTIVLSSFHQVPVAVYYESLCPDSAKFITEQLYPALKSELRDLVEITFVPFGKSQVSDWDREKERERKGENKHTHLWSYYNVLISHSSPHKAPRWPSPATMDPMSAMATRCMPAPLSTFRPTPTRLNIPASRWHWTLSTAWWRRAKTSPIMCILDSVAPLRTTSTTGRISRTVPTLPMAAFCFARLAKPHSASRSHWPVCPQFSSMR